jgi:hypothetical protein
MRIGLRSANLFRGSIRCWYFGPFTSLLVSLKVSSSDLRLAEMVDTFWRDVVISDGALRVARRRVQAVGSNSLKGGLLLPLLTL